MDVDPITEVTNALFLLRPGGRVPERPHTSPSGCGGWERNTDCGEEQGWGQCSSVRAGCSNSAQTHTGTLGDYCCLIYHSQVSRRWSASKFHHTLTFTDSEDYCISTVREHLYELHAFSWISAVLKFSTTTRSCENGFIQQSYEYLHKGQLHICNHFKSLGYFNIWNILLSFLISLFLDK